MAALLTMEMQFERDFVKQGGLLMFGFDRAEDGSVRRMYGALAWSFPTLRFAKDGAT